MSVKRLTERLIDLQAQTNLRAKDINSLREAAGADVSAAERSLVDHFVREHRTQLSEAVIREIERQFELRVPKYARLSVVEERKIDLGEASGIAAIKDKLLVIDDEKGLFLQSPDGTSGKLLGAKHEKSARGLEGLCVDPDNKSAYVLSEDTRRISKVPLKWKGDTLVAAKPEEVGKLPRLGETDNKGWEGIDILPGRFSQDGHDRMVAVHEGSPRRIGIFSMPDLHESTILKLPDTLDRQIKDLSDIAICPKTGHLFLLSDESACIVELELTTKRISAPGALLEQPQLEMLHRFDLPASSKSKPEGICFGPDGNTIWVVSEGDRKLWKIDVERP